MPHLPYGYIISNGVAEIDKGKADQIKQLYTAYLDGYGLVESARKAGIEKYHATIGRILANRCYICDGYYPQIISQDIFDKVQIERERRIKELGRIGKSKSKPCSTIATSFSISKIHHKYKNPFKQAEYAYNLIKVRR